MSFRESALTFRCDAETLVGVLATPASERAHRVGVVIVVGGPQYRAGSHRQFVHLARALSGAGWPTLRFDVRGMGDSSGAPRSFEALGADVGAAVDALKAARPEIDRVVLWGLCDGASAALMYLQERADRRVAGLCLANPWVRSVESLARTHVRQYYLQRLLQPTFWRKLVAGKVGWSSLGELATTLRTYWSSRRAGAASASAAPSGDFRQRMLAGLSAFDGPALLLLSRNDYTAKEFADHVAQDPAWRRATDRRSVQRLDLDADHTFSDRASEEAMHDACIAWLAASFAPAGAAARAVETGAIA